MRAIEYTRHGAPDVLELVERDDPAPGEGEYAVDLHAASVSPFDCKLRAGHLQKFFRVEFPKIPGRDGAGIVSAVGGGVSGFRVGDRVGVMAGHGRTGSYASKRLCLPREMVALPARLDFAEAASLVNSGLSAWICTVDVAAVEPGMRVLVHGGSGAVGGLIVQLASHLGATVTATCRAANRDHVIALGADRAIAYDKEDFGTLRDQDVVFDLIGGETHARSYAVLKKGGHLVYLVAEPIVERGDEFGVRVTRAMISDRPEAVGSILDLVARGAMRPQVAARLPLEEAAEAHRRMEAGAVTRGRLELEM